MRPALALALALALLAGPAAAAMPERPVDPALRHLKEEIEAGRAAAALPELERIDRVRPDDADVLNLLGFAHRKLGATDLARGFYDRALALDPVHEGALEYLGELEIQLGRIEAARAVERRLAAICYMGCDALDDLRAALAAVK